jgi:hypothetical protein
LVGGDGLDLHSGEYVASLAEPTFATFDASCASLSGPEVAT